MAQRRRGERARLHRLLDDLIDAHEAVLGPLGLTALEHYGDIVKPLRKISAKYLRGNHTANGKTHDDADVISISARVFIHLFDRPHRMGAERLAARFVEGDPAGALTRIQSDPSACRDLIASLLDEGVPFPSEISKLLSAGLADLDRNGIRGLLAPRKSGRPAVSFLMPLMRLSIMAVHRMKALGVEPPQADRDVARAMHRNVDVIKQWRRRVPESDHVHTVLKDMAPQWASEASVGARTRLAKIEKLKLSIRDEAERLTRDLASAHPHLAVKVTSEEREKASKDAIRAWLNERWGGK